MAKPPIESLTGANSGHILRIEVIWYNHSTMSSILTPVDISNMPELLDLVEEVEAAKTPRELKRDDRVVAVLTPVVQKKRANQESTDDALLRLVRLGEKLQLKAPADVSSRHDDYLYGDKE